MDPSQVSAAITAGASSRIGAVYADRLARRRHVLTLAAGNRVRFDPLTAQRLTPKYRFPQPSHRWRALLVLRCWVQTAVAMPYRPLLGDTVPVVRDDLLAKVPVEFRVTIDAVSERLTTADLMELNQKVVIDRDDPDGAAATWLRGRGLVP